MFSFAGPAEGSNDDEKEKLLGGSMERPKVNLPDGWRKKRTITMVMFLTCFFMQGLEFTTIYATLWWYVNNDFKNSDPDLTYGLIACGRFIAPLLLSIITARWFDTNRSMKRLMLSITSLMSAGYMLYMLHFSPALPVLGTILQGGSFILSAAINSEAIRVYRGDEVQRAMLFFLIAYGAGETIGSLLVQPLEHVDFLVGELHITYGNVIAFILMGINTIRLVLIFFFTTDLSKEFDLKAEEGQAPQSAAYTQTSEPQPLVKMFSLDSILLLFQHGYTTVLTSFVARSFPLVTNTLEYSNFILDNLFLGASLLMTIFSILINLTKPSSKGVYVCGIVNLASLLLSQICLFLIPMKLSEPVNILLVICLVLTYALCWITDQTFIIVTLGKLFPSSVQTSVEGIRMLVHILGAFTASLASVYIYKNFQTIIIVSVPLCVLLFVMMIMRKGVLIDPEASRNVNEVF